MSTTLPTTENSLVVRFAKRYGVLEGKLLTTLRATAWKASDPTKPATDEQLMALLIVADQYKLNPFTKEIFAFEDSRKGIVPVVSVDGWVRIINEHPEYDGVEFRYAEGMAPIGSSRVCHEWCESILYRKDRSRPTVVREYLDEVYRNTGPWNGTTKRMLRHKALIQGARVAFGFAGIYDEDEAHRILETIVPERTSGPAASTGGGANLDALREGLSRREGYGEPMDAEFTDTSSQEPASAEPEPTPQGEGSAGPEDAADGGMLAPDEIEHAISAATHEQQLEALLPSLQDVSGYDKGAWKDLTTKLLAKKQKLMGIG